MNNIGEAFTWAFLTWRKYLFSWLFLWVTFVVGFLLYAICAFIIGMINPLLAILVYLLGCVLPSYIYSAFIKIGFKEYGHQQVNKSFFRYLNFGAALDIVLSRFFVLLVFVGLLFICIPLQYFFTHMIIASKVPIINVLCFFIAYALFYFYPYVVVDQSAGKGIFKRTFLYAYKKLFFVVFMTFLWAFALFVTFFTFGLAGFFVFPLLTLVDIYMYEQIKI